MIRCSHSNGVGCSLTLRLWHGSVNRLSVGLNAVPIQTLGRRAIVPTDRSPAQAVFDSREQGTISRVAAY